MAGDPVTKALLDVYGSYADRRQAEIDLERAKAKEAITGRSAVPNVVAELRARAEKEARKKEQIAKRSQEGGQGASPASMAPPTTEVTGQTAGRDPSAALAAGGEILAKVFGKSGKVGGPLSQATPANPQGTPAGGIFNQSTPGIGQGINPAAAAPGSAPAPAPSGPPAPPTQPGTVPTGAPGGVQVVTQPLDTWQRVLRGAGAIAAVALRQPALAIGLGEEAIKGEQEVGRRPLPTAQEEQERIFREGVQEGKVLTPVLREAQAAAGTDKAGEAGQKVRDALEDIRKRRGDEVALQAVHVATAQILEREQEDALALERAQAASGIIAERQAQTAAERLRAKTQSEKFRNQEMAAVFQRDIAQGKPSSSYGGQTYDAGQRRKFLDELNKASLAARIGNTVADKLNLGNVAAPPSPEQFDAAKKRLKDRGEAVTKESMARELGLQ